MNLNPIWTENSMQKIFLSILFNLYKVKNIGEVPAVLDVTRSLWSSCSSNGNFFFSFSATIRNFLALLVPVNCSIFVIENILRSGNESEL